MHRTATVRFAGESMTQAKFDALVLRVVRQLTSRVNTDVTKWEVARWLFHRPQQRTFDRIETVLDRLHRQRKVRRVTAECCMGIVRYYRVRRAR